MTRIKQYDMSHVDYDVAVFNEILVRKGVTPDGNMFADIIEGSKAVGKYMVAKEFSKAVGTTILMPFSPIVRIVNAITNLTPTIRNTIKKTIKKSLDKGLTGKSLSNEIKKVAPDISDKDLADIVKSATKAADEVNPTNTSGPTNPPKPVEPEVKPVEPEVKPVEPEVKPVEPQSLDEADFLNNTAQFTQTLKTAKPLSKEGKEAMRGIRDEALRVTNTKVGYDEWIGNGNKGSPSQYFIRNAHKVPVEDVKNYYKLNPAKLGGEDAGMFGIPKAIRVKYGLEQEFVQVPKGYMAHSFAPGLAGVEQNEDGSFTYDPITGIAAMGAIGLGRKYGVKIKNSNKSVYFISKAKQVVDRLPNKGSIRVGDLKTFLLKRGVKADEYRALDLGEFESRYTKSIPFINVKNAIDVRAGEELTRVPSDKFTGQGYHADNVPGPEKANTMLRTSDELWETGYSSPHYNTQEVYSSRGTRGELGGKPTEFVLEVQSDLHQNMSKLDSTDKSFISKGSSNSRNWMEKALEDRIYEATKNGNTQIAVPLGNPAGTSNVRSENLGKTTYSENGKIRRVLEALKTKHGGTIRVESTGNSEVAFKLDDEIEAIPLPSSYEEFSDVIAANDGDIGKALIATINDLEKQIDEVTAMDGSMLEIEMYNGYTTVAFDELKRYLSIADAIPSDDTIRSVIRNPENYKSLLELAKSEVKQEKINYLVYEWPKDKNIEIELY
jgi:hypothetical protein